jgi:hypothetical protein
VTGPCAAAGAPRGGEHSCGEREGEPWYQLGLLVCRDGHHLKPTSAVLTHEYLEVLEPADRLEYELAFGVAADELRQEHAEMVGAGADGALPRR